MTASTPRMTIVCADDDADDRLMTRDAFDELGLGHDLTFVEDGVELLDLLKRRGRFAGGVRPPRPSMILLDLNMPRMDGREALQAIKADPELRQIPVVVMTTSVAEADVCASYDIGANSYIVKPVTFHGLVELLRDLGRYWLEVVQLPISREEQAS